MTPELIRQQLGLSDCPASDALDRRIALHECGHALVATALDLGLPSRILIPPRAAKPTVGTQPIVPVSPITWPNSLC